MRVYRPHINACHLLREITKQFYIKASDATQLVTQLNVIVAFRQVAVMIDDSIHGCWT